MRGQHLLTYGGQRDEGVVEAVQVAPVLGAGVNILPKLQET